MLVACEKSLQKLHVHNWGMVNSFVWHIIISVVEAPHCLALAKPEERQGTSTKGFMAVGVVSGLCRWQH